MYLGQNNFVYGICKFLKCKLLKRQKLLLSISTCLNSFNKQILINNKIINTCVFAESPEISVSELLKR